MNTFSNIKELLFALYREEKLLTEMFKKRKTTDYKYEYALDLVENNVTNQDLTRRVSGVYCEQFPVVPNNLSSYLSTAFEPADLKRLPLWA